ncbi:ATP-binding protein [Paenibacillus sp. FSL P2-0136]|uniref:ATP-dependent nuclease n=1 Tax=Paenibacillus sp. FSL P2-0136 TaxID=2975317 RepID=UPI0030D74751
MMHSRFWIQNIKSQFFTDNAFLGMENNEKLIEVINILEKMEFYISDEPTYYYYSNNSIDTRANVYYENIGLFKIYIEVDNKHADYAIITIEKIRRTEIDTRRIQDLTDELDSNWENVFLKKKYYGNSESIESFKKDIIELKQIIDTYIKNRTKIPDILLELKSIKIKNFKKITTATIDLKNELNIIVGMNNAGKSSFIQGILLAYQALFTLLKENRIRFRKNGSINLQHDLFPSARIDKFPFLLGSPFDLFNKNSKNSVSKGVQLFKFIFQNDLSISISGRIVGDVFSVYISDCSDQISKNAIADFIERPITLIPSFFNVVTNEERKSPGRYNSLLKTGNYNQLFRNLLYDLKEDKKNTFENPDEIEMESSKTPPQLYKFSELQQIIDDVFGIKDLDVRFNPDEDEFITATYQVGTTNDDKQERLDISTLGMGTLQFIQVVTQVLSGAPRIIMLDEPDAHLHTKLQVRIIDLLKEFSEKYNVKFIVATHSKDIINNVNPRQVLTFSEDNVLTSIDDMDGFIGTIRNLGATTEELIGLNIGKRVVLVEGVDDSLYIKKLYEKFTFDHGNSNYNLINFIPLGGRDNVISNHLDKFLGNIEDLSDFKKLAIFDKDYRFENQQNADAKKLRKKGFSVIEWKLKELENYFFIPEIIMDLINTKYPQNNHVSIDDITNIVDEIYKDSKISIIFEFAKTLSQLRKEELEKATGEKFKDIIPSKEYFLEFWDEATSYVESQNQSALLSGKEILNALRTKLIVKNTPSAKNFVLDIINSLSDDTVHPDLKLLLNEIKNIAL